MCIDLLHHRRHLSHPGALLLDRGRDLCRRIRRGLDGCGQALEPGRGALGQRESVGDNLLALAACLHRCLRRQRNVDQDRFDLIGRLLGLLGEPANLLGHDGKAAAVLTGARCLDVGIQREQL